MLKIDRLVLRLPDEFSSRGRALGRAIGAALATYRAPHAQARAELTANLRDVSPAASDTAIADTVVRAVAAQLNGDHAGKGPSS
jgi:hypothetical protein